MTPILKKKSYIYISCYEKYQSLDTKHMITLRIIKGGFILKDEQGLGEPQGMGQQ